MQISTVYNFSTNAPGLLGVQIKNAKLVGILDFDTACMYEDVGGRYRQIYPLLPPGTADDPRSCLYYRFKAESGEFVIFSEQWINLNTVEAVSSVSFQVVINNANVNDVNRVRDSLNALGLSNYVIKLL